MRSITPADVTELVANVTAMGTACRGTTWATGNLAFRTADPCTFMVRLGQLLGSDTIDAEVAECFDHDLDVRASRSGDQFVVWFPGITVE